MFSLLSAFRNVPMVEEDLRFLAFTWDGKYYINASMAFGSASSCKIFERIATVLQWIVTSETGWKWISHYLDDFPMLAKTKEGLLVQIQKYLALMREIGMPVAEEKTLGPTQFLEYLGLLLNLVNLTLQIPDDKRKKNLKRIQKMLEVFRGRKKTTIKKIQKLAGSLNFLCAAIPAGKVFLSSLYKLTRSPTGIPNPSHHKRITREVYEDLLVFQTFLQDCGKEEFRSIPFLIRRDVFNTELQFLADASGASDKGFGCLLKNSWAFGRWDDTRLFADGFKPNIALLELYAIVIAVELWCRDLSGTGIILHSDNMATVNMINSMRAEIPAAHQLLKHLSLTCLRRQIYFKAIHIEGTLNTLTDSLSRLQFQRFHQLHPTANSQPDPLPANLWPPEWTSDQMKPPKRPCAPKSNTWNSKNRKYQHKFRGRQQSKQQKKRSSLSQSRHSHRRRLP